MKIWFAFDTAVSNTWSFYRQDDDGHITRNDTAVDILRPFYWKAIAGIVTVVYGKTLQTYGADVPDTPDDIHVKAPQDIEAWQTPEWGSVRTRYSKSGDPNEVQVGGDHYKGVDFQPWDWARNVSGTQGLGYYEVSAISYIARFRKKGGIEDLEKVLHYIDKMLYCWRAGEYVNRCTATLLRIRQFNKENECDRFQSEAIHFLVAWREGDELVETKKIVEELIQRERDDAYLDKMAAERLEPYPLVIPTEEFMALTKPLADAATASPPPMAVPALGLVRGNGTGKVGPAPDGSLLMPATNPPEQSPAPVFDVSTAPLPPYKPLKPALKIPKGWNDDSDPDKLVKHD